MPKTGSDGFGLRAAEDFGHAMHPTYPALTPLLAGARPHDRRDRYDRNAFARFP
ncbi:MAG: NAD(P)/FAD-dependent oxidoreductase [Pseudomonadota bacterium]